MNPANLPFDSETMLERLRTWVECESPTWDAGAVDRMLYIAARYMAIMGATIERIAGRQGPSPAAPKRITTGRYAIARFNLEATEPWRHVWYDAPDGTGIAEMLG